MPSRRDFLSAGVGALTSGSVLAVADTVTDSTSGSTDQAPTTRTPTPTTTTVHTSTSDPTTTHTPATTTTSTTTTTTTTTTSEDSTCDSEKFDCQTISAAQELGESVRESVVFIEVRYKGSSWSRGTGWFADDNGHIVTNGHVVEDHHEMTVYTLDGEKYTPTLKGSEMESPDAALLQIDADSQPLSIGSADSLDEGQPLLEVGHPGVVGAWVISLGRYEGRIQYLDKPDDVKTVMPTAEGSSGSATMNLDGNVVALTYGMKGRDPRFRGETPEPVEPDVHDELDRNVISAHEPISEVMDHVDDWK